MKRFFRNNGLSLVLILIFLVCLLAQTITGFKEYNNELREKGSIEITMSRYLISGHFIEATFENWESEFLQMGMFVVLSAFLFQKGSSESNDPDEKREEKTPGKNKKNPFPAKKGSFVFSLYKFSLSIAFLLLFLLSFLLHWYGSHIEYNHEQVLKGASTESAITYLTNTRFWFESFQNWQSEFLAVLAVVVLTIFFRHEGSPQSKKVTDPNSQTGA